MVSFSAVSFALANLVAGYLAALVFTPPYAGPKTAQDWSQDSFRFVNHPFAVRSAQGIAFGASLYHAWTVLRLDGRGKFNKENDYLNPNLFTWTRYTSTCLLLSILVGAPLRLAAFGALGSRFTFSLAPPNELNTSGIYSWIQHPSYAGLFLVVAPHMLLCFRWDGAFSQCIPRAILERLDGCGSVGVAVMLAVAAITMSLRISEEEAMLKDVFGAKWVKWNKETSRLIPGVF